MKRIFALVFLCFMMITVVTGCGMVEEAGDKMSTMMTDVSEAMDNDADNGKVTDDDGIIEDNSNDDTSNDENANFNDGVGNPVIESTGTTNATESSNNSRSNNSNNSTSSTSFPDTIV